MADFAALDIEFELPDFGMEDMDFDLSGFDAELQAATVENRYVKPALFRPVKSSEVKYDRAEGLAHDFGGAVLSGARVDALLSGNFVFGDFIEALAVGANAKFDDITMSTLSISQENVDSLHNLMVGGFLDTLNVIVSDYFWAHNRINAPYIYEQLDIGDRFQLAVAGTHTKITLIRHGDAKIVMHGSANLRSSRSVEAVTIETNPELYDFHMGWHKTILDHHATIKKSIRASALFDLITKDASGEAWQ